MAAFANLQPFLAAACRDIKPANLLLQYAPWFKPAPGGSWTGVGLFNLRLVVGDMGLASYCGFAERDLTYAGTYGHRAPEVEKAWMQVEQQGSSSFANTGKVDTW